MRIRCLNKGKRIYPNGTFVLARREYPVVKDSSGTKAKD